MTRLKLGFHQLVYKFPKVTSGRVLRPDRMAAGPRSNSHQRDRVGYRVNFSSQSCSHLRTGVAKTFHREERLKGILRRLLRLGTSTCISPLQSAYVLGTVFLARLPQRFRAMFLRTRSDPFVFVLVAVFVSFFLNQELGFGFELIVIVACFADSSKWYNQLKRNDFDSLDEVQHQYQRK